MKNFIYIFCLTFLVSHFASAQAFYREFDDEAINSREQFSPAVITVFPNPSVNNATVVLNYIPVRKIFVEIFDYNGNLRRSYAFAPGSQQLNFDVSFLNAGHYLVYVRDAARRIATVRIVKN